MAIRSGRRTKEKKEIKNESRRGGGGGVQK